MEQLNQLNHLFNLNQKNDLLYVNEIRHLLIPSSSFGILQRELIENIGLERMKTFFFRYGWNIGIEDAKEITKDLSISLMEKIQVAPIFHSLKGHVVAKITEQELETDGDRVVKFLLKGYWEESYEAEQHIKNLGIADHPICYTLTGYASGSMSHILGEKVFFKEHQCKGAGDSYCTWEGRMLSDWEESAYEEFINNSELPILKELEQTYEKLLYEKNNLSLVMKIEHELTDAVVKGNNIETILCIVEKHIKRPVIVEDVFHQILKVKGITKEEYDPIQSEFKGFLEKNALQYIKTLQHSDCCRLVTPIFLQEKMVGYCSFLYDVEDKLHKEVDSMIIRRLSTVCSFILLNEKVRLESMERVKGYFFEEIMNGKYQSEQEVLQKAFFIDLDFTGGYYALHLKYHITAGPNKLNPNFHNEIFECVTKYMSEQNIRVLIGQKTDSLQLLLPQKQLGGKQIGQMMYPFMSFLRKRLKDTVWFAGISLMHSKVLEEVQGAFREAYTAVKLSTREVPMTFFQELGILGVLITQDNKVAIRNMAELTLGNLYKDLDQGKVELIGTLYTFLTNGGNFEQTAEQLAISISGLRYRLTKITSFLGSDLREPERRFQLLLALKALIILDDEWLEILN
ncbi:XylR N-terminal domain-containing protein [Bacillus benzoevorans]|uniref:Putative hydrocarbon binding protein n=1 Tax=Bacillus benzoevorans TaxID=1456 RepID=A0A7X0HVE2_9BACI|nr:XylR N-terminal domain-containing protein [Bacillus benzoevorans]MBB6446642.1 putative hydrocarbon binding protein [Bacillus benzoevorans]